MSPISDASPVKSDERRSLPSGSIIAALKRWESMLDVTNTLSKLLDIRNVAYVVEKLFEDDSEMLLETACKLRLRSEYRIGRKITESSSISAVEESKNPVPAKETTQRSSKNKTNDYGVSEETVKIWQEMATLPEKQLENYLASHSDRQRSYKKYGVKGFFKYAGLSYPTKTEETDSSVLKRIKFRNSSISRLLSRVIDLEDEVRILRLIINRFPPEQVDEVIDAILGSE